MTKKKKRIETVNNVEFMVVFLFSRGAQCILLGFGVLIRRALIGIKKIINVQILISGLPPVAELL